MAAVFEVELVTDAGGMKFDGILRVGCILPGGGPTPAGAIEGAEISFGGVDFVAIPEDRGTLFILLGDDGDGDDDEEEDD